MSARRHGGQYSPGGASGPLSGRRAARVSVSARLMYLAPIPLLFAGLIEVLTGDALGMVVELGAGVILMGGAVLLNQGLQAEAAYDARAIARPPAVPRKAFAAATTGAGVFLAAGFATGSGLLAGLIFGAAALAAHILAFGLDPMRSKGVGGPADYDSERAAKAIDSAEAVIAEILAAARQIRDRRLEARVEAMTGAVREVIRRIEEDPADLPRARKFLGVYLTGARDATRQFAALYARRQDRAARADYEALLDDLESSFRQHRDDLLKDDKSALDIEIEVLRERLHREGV